MFLLPGKTLADVPGLRPPDNLSQARPSQNGFIAASGEGYVLTVTYRVFYHGY